MEKPAKLVLEDGTVFHGTSFSVHKPIVGEVVFNTGMVGYCESFTDPSYQGQILVLTYPLIGNYGVPAKTYEDNLLKFFESSSIKISGLIVSEYSKQESHWNSFMSLKDWLKEQNIPALYGIDTRALTKKLREKGVMLGKIVFGKDIPLEDPNKRNLAAEVSVREPVIYGNFRKRVALIDVGAKNNIIRSFLKRKISVLMVPWNYDLFNGKYKFDGIMVSNGPGNPKTMTETVETVKKAIEYNTPTFGICFGSQILALAAGANTYKLKYGHRSQNQPCYVVGTNTCYITSQNHGFAVDEKSLPKDWLPWFRNLNDETNEGIRHKKKNFMAVQFHPEATPGPVDTAFLFDKFIKVFK